MSRYEPKNREEAFTYQFEDDVKVLRTVSLTKDRESFEKQLQVLEQRIGTYRKLAKKK